MTRPSYDELIRLKKEDVKCCVKMGAVFSLLLYFSLKYEFYVGAVFSSLTTLLLAVAFKNELRNLSELREAAKQEELNKPLQKSPKVSDAQQLTAVTFMDERTRRSASADAAVMQVRHPGRFSYYS